MPLQENERRLWRIGRKVGRTIYAQVEREPSDADELIGLMDTEDLAAEAVRAHNEDVLTAHLWGSGGS